MLLSTLRAVFTAAVLPILILLSTASRATLRDIPYVSIISVKPQDEQHVLSAFLITLLAWWWLKRRFHRWAPFAAFAVSMVAAVAVEFVQYTLPHRDGGIDDLEPGLVGSVAALVVAYLFIGLVSLIRRQRLGRPRRQSDLA